MEKKEIFDALDDFSQTLFVTLAEVDALKKHLQDVIEENTALRLETTKLREQLSETIHSPSSSPVSAREKLYAIYDDGFHVCRQEYSKRLNNPPCMFCLSVLEQE